MPTQKLQFTSPELRLKVTGAGTPGSASYDGWTLREEWDPDRHKRGAEPYGEYRIIVERDVSSYDEVDERLVEGVHLVEDLERVWGYATGMALRSRGFSIGLGEFKPPFRGDLEGTSKGEMLTGGTRVKGSAAYVAMERVSGTLNGKRGTFILHHTGVMTRGAPSLAITVVPDSGTGELEGLSGTMSIEIANGKHSYVFEYTLAGKS